MMNDRISIERNISAIFEQKLHLTLPPPGTDLFESGSLDSLSFVELLLQVELEYGIKIPLQDLELENFRSLGKIAAFIGQKLDAENAKSERVAEYVHGAAQSLQLGLEPEHRYIEAKCPA
jgi:methoxymalonate biosynthesis acyl carrier protein